MFAQIAAFQFMGDLSIKPDMSIEEKKRRASLIIQKCWANYRMNALLKREADPSSAEEEEEKELATEPMALFIFAEDNPVRQLLTSLNSNGYFNTFIMLAIIVSSICLAFEHPENDKNSTMMKNLLILDVVLTVVFVFEMFTKIISRGFVMAPASYLQDSWDRIDFLIVLISVIGLFEFAEEWKALRVLRTFRVLRPLRALRRFPQLAAITATLVSSLIPVSIVAFIAFFVVCIFAVLWVALQKGKLFQCTADEDFDDHAAYLAFDTCSQLGGTWSNSGQNFDNIFNSLLTLFEVMTLEDWQGVMYASIDTTDIDANYEQTYERQYRGTWGWGIMYMIFVMVGAFFFLNLIVGVVVNAFDMNDKMNQTDSDRDEAKKRKQTGMITKAGPIFVGGYYTGMRQPAFEMLTSTAWDMAIAACIVLNVAAMAFEHAEQSETTTNFLYGLNIVFTIIFTFELGVKLIALGVTRCFQDRWNTFDAIIGESAAAAATTLTAAAPAAAAPLHQLQC